MQIAIEGQIMTFTIHDTHFLFKMQKFHSIATLVVFSAWFMLCLSLSLEFLHPLLYCWSLEVSCRSVVKRRKVVLAVEIRSL